MKAVDKETTKQPGIDIATTATVPTATAVPSTKAEPTIKTVEIELNSLKSESWSEVIYALKLDDTTVRRFFDHSEYASIQIEIDEKLNIVGGRLLPRK